MATATQTRTSVAVWFEIPAENLERAVSFYSSVFAQELKVGQFGPDQMAVFARREENGNTGCVVAGPGRKPGSDGPLVYLNADGDLKNLLGRVEKAGGSIVVPFTVLPETMGSYAVIADTEGNHIGVHEAA